MRDGCGGCWCCGPRGAHAGTDSLPAQAVTYSSQKVPEPVFLNFLEPRNRFYGIYSASLCSLAVRYDNPITTRCLAPIIFLKIPAQYTVFVLSNEKKFETIVKTTKYICAACPSFMRMSTLSSLFLPFCPCTPKLLVKMLQ